MKMKKTSVKNGQNPRSYRVPLERMLHMHELLLAGQYPNARTLAEAHQISPRTAQRDIDHMLAHLELPLEYDRKRHGYFYGRPVDRFPGSAGIDEAELISLMVARKATAPFHAPFTAKLDERIRKLMAGATPESRRNIQALEEGLSFRPFTPEDVDPGLLELVARGIIRNRTLAFSYRKPGERELEPREVHPYSLTCITSRWYLIGYDPDRAGFRTFALTRMQAPELTLREFARRADFNLDEYLRDSFRIMKGPGDYEVAVEFDPWLTDILRGRLIHSTQRVTELPSGASRVSIRVSCLQEVKEWLMGWSGHANVLRPDCLRAELREAGRGLDAQYDGRPTGTQLEFDAQLHQCEKWSWGPLFGRRSLKHLSE